MNISSTWILIYFKVMQVPSQPISKTPTQGNLFSAFSIWIMIESFFMQNEWNDLFKYDRFDILVEVCKLFKKQKLSKNSPHKNVYKLTNNFIAYCRVGFEKKYLHSPHNGNIVSKNLKKVQIWKEFHLPTIYISTLALVECHKITCLTL